MVEVKLVRMAHAADLALPAYATDGAAGMDVLAAVEGELLLPPGGRAAVPNTPGTIDSDYRGEVKIILANLGAEPFTVTRGMRIAQLVLAPFVRGVWAEVERLDATVRGEGGFGSTGRQ